MTILQYLRRVEGVIKDAPAQMNAIVDELSEFYADLNREQLAQGVTSDGKDIGDRPPYFKTDYFPNHAFHRQMAGVQTDYIDLKITGTFWKSIFAERKGDTLEIFSTDDSGKVRALMFGGSGGGGGCCKRVRQGGFGENIFGLTEKSKVNARLRFNQEMVKWVLSRL